MLLVLTVLAATFTRHDRSGTGINVIVDNKKTLNFTRVNILRTLRSGNVCPAIITNADVNTLINTLCTGKVHPVRVFRVIHERRLSGLDSFVSLDFSGDGGVNLSSRRRAESVLRGCLPRSSFSRLGVPFCLYTAGISSNEVIVGNRNSALVTCLVKSDSVPKIFRPIRVGNGLRVSNKICGGLPTRPVESGYIALVNISIGSRTSHSPIGAAGSIIFHTLALLVCRGAHPNEGLYGCMVSIPIGCGCKLVSFGGFCSVCRIKCSAKLGCIGRRPSLIHGTDE